MSSTILENEDLHSHHKSQARPAPLNEHFIHIFTMLTHLCS